MRQNLSIPEAVADPLISELRRADGISDEAFAQLLLAASDAYRASAIMRLHRRRADLFYQTIGAGLLEDSSPVEIPQWRIERSIADW